MILLAALALAALLGMSGSATASPGKNSRIAFRDTVSQPVLAGGAAYYRSASKHREVLKRLDLGTGRRTIVFRAKRSSHSISEVRGGGGRVAIETFDESARSVRSEVLASQPGGRRLRRVAGGRETDHRNGEGLCGTEVGLRDVGPDGAVLVEKDTRPCSGQGSETAVVRAYPPGAEAREVYRFVLDELADRTYSDAVWRFVAGRLLIWTGTEATVRDISGGAPRRITPSDRKGVLESVDLGPDGHVVLSELRGIGTDRLTNKVRLLRPGEQAAAGQVLVPFQRRLVDARFCGNELVTWTTGRAGRTLLTVHRAARGPLVHRGRLPRRRSSIESIVCDRDAHAIFFDLGRKRWLVQVVGLS